MLRSVKALYNYILAAEDGNIGRCKDFLFDDILWTIRYMEADTGNWLLGHRVLISPISLGEPDWSSRLFYIRLTRKQVEEAPELDKDAPVSRQHEIRWARYYGWQYYWDGNGVWGSADFPNALLIQKAIEEAAEESSESDDPHLRSAEEVMGYHIRTTDDKIGHVEDFIIDDETWTIRYLVVDTRNWLPGRKVLIVPEWINSVDWWEKKVSVNLTKEEVKNSPEYDPTAPVNREYEIQLYDFYGRPRYW